MDDADVFVLPELEELKFRTMWSVLGSIPP
jgi:hypothetical protein